MNCPTCGKQNPEGEKRCVHCLKPLFAETASPATSSGIPFNPPRAEQDRPTQIEYANSGASALPRTGSLSGQAGGFPGSPGSNLGYPLSCRVCGDLIAPGRSKCSRCKVPAGMVVNPDDPTASTFLIVDLEVAAALDPRVRRANRVK